MNDRNIEAMEANIMASTRKVFIKIYNVKEIMEFVVHAGKVDGDVTVYRGKYVIDGKSLMGIFSIDLSDGVQVEYPEDAAEFAEYIKKFQ